MLTQNKAAIQMEHCGFVTLEHVLAHDRLTALTALSIFIQACLMPYACSLPYALCLLPELVSTDYRSTLPLACLCLMPLACVLALDRLTALTALAIFIHFQAMRGVSELHLRGQMHRCTCVASWQSSA
jgi:hypothetical protein